MLIFFNRIFLNNFFIICHLKITYNKQIILYMYVYLTHGQLFKYFDTTQFNKKKNYFRQKLQQLHLKSFFSDPDFELLTLLQFPIMQRIRFFPRPSNCAKNFRFFWKAPDRCSSKILITY